MGQEPRGMRRLPRLPAGKNRSYVGPAETSSRPRLHVIDAVMIFRENIRPEWEAALHPGVGAAEYMAHVTQAIVT